MLCSVFIVTAFMAFLALVDKSWALTSDSTPTTSHYFTIESVNTITATASSATSVFAVQLTTPTMAHDMGGFAQVFLRSRPL